MLVANEIASKYGVDGKKLMQQYLKASIRLVKTSNRIKFLLNCRRCKVIPKCLGYRVRLNLTNDRSRRELENVVVKHKIRILSIMVADAKRASVELKRKKSVCIIK